MIDNEKTVYILGAGFSRAFSDKFPLMNDFLKDVDNEKYWKFFFGKKGKEILIEWIDRHYGKKTNINIEELMTIFEYLKEGYLEAHTFEALEQQRNYAEHLILALKHYIQNRLNILPGIEEFENEEIKKQKEHIDIFKFRIDLNLVKRWGLKLRYQNSYFICFNLDLLLDFILIKASNDENIIKEQKNNLQEMQFNSTDSNMYDVYGSLPLSLMKLHGSINWFSCTSDICPEHYKIIIEDSKIYKKYSLCLNEDSRVFCRTCGSPINLVMLPPHLVKILDKYPRLKILWKYASTALYMSKNIVVIGYSFPINDTRTTYLMQRSLGGLEKEKNWTIVDLNPNKIKKRLKQILPRHTEQIDNAKVYSGNNCVLDYLKTFSS